MRSSPAPSSASPPPPPLSLAPTKSGASRLRDDIARADDRDVGNTNPRVLNALRLIEAAQHTLEAACRDLSNVDGYSRIYRDTCSLADQVKEHWHRVDGRRIAGGASA